MGGCLSRPLLGTRPATRVCALTGNRTSDTSVCKSALIPLSHTSQGYLTTSIHNLIIIKTNQYKNYELFCIILFIISSLKSGLCLMFIAHSNSEQPHFNGHKWLMISPEDAPEDPSLTGDWPCISLMFSFLLCRMGIEPSSES